MRLIVIVLMVMTLTGLASAVSIESENVLVVAAAGGPQIDSVSGSLAHKQSVTISGSGFGTHPDESQSDSSTIAVKFDDFENGANGNKIENGWDCSPDNTGSGQASWQPRYTTLNQKTGSSLSSYHNFNDPIQECSMRLWRESGWREAYVSYWVRLAITQVGDPQNYKQVRIDTDSGERPGMDFDANWAPGEGSLKAHFCPNLILSGIDWDCGSYQNYIWSRKEFWYRMGDDPGQRFKFWENAEQLKDYTSPSAFPNGIGAQWGDYGYPTYIALGFWIRYGSEGYVQMDDIYLSTTQARIELGDKSTFSSCTLREIQIPTAWSSSSITFTANQGSFKEGDTVYLYVVDADGNVNANGYPIIIWGGPIPPCTDSDGDGYGNPASAICAHPALDCDDTNPNINPGKPEICNDAQSLDEDCDGWSNAADLGCMCTDSDGDGYGNPASAICAHPALDCDDTNPNINPGKTEVCNDAGALDEDCDGKANAQDTECICSQEAITKPCWCGSTYASSGYCCNNQHSDRECSLPIAYYKFENNARDSAGSNHGSFTGTYTAEKFGLAADFNGESSYMSISGGGLDNLGPMTFTAWIYPRSVSEPYARIYEKTYGTSLYLDTTDTWPSSARLVFTVHHSLTDLKRETDELAVMLSSDDPVPHHVAVTWDGSSDADGAKIYVNGFEYAPYDKSVDGTGDKGYDTYTPFYIGGKATEANFDGLIDEVRIYNRVLSADEIRELASWGCSQELEELYCNDYNKCTIDKCVDEAGINVCRWTSADLDGSGTIGMGDVMQITPLWAVGQGQPGYDPNKDLDGSGTIGMGDVMQITPLWTEGCPP